MTPQERIGLLIRSTHPLAYRRGEWGRVARLQEVPTTAPRFGRMRTCYVVEWDAVRHGFPSQDLWPVEDADAGYEFAAVLP